MSLPGPSLHDDFSSRKKSQLFTMAYTALHLASSVLHSRERKLVEGGSRGKQKSLLMYKSIEITDIAYINS